MLVLSQGMAIIYSLNSHRRFIEGEIARLARESDNDLWDRQPEDLENSILFCLQRDLVIDSTIYLIYH